MIQYRCYSVIRSENFFTAIVGIERTMSNHTLEAVFLSLTAFAIPLGPRAHLDHLPDFCGAPVHEGVPRSGCDDHKVSGVLLARDVPRPTLDPGAIRSGAHQRGVKAVEASMLVVVEPAEQAPALRVKGTSQGDGIDRTVDDTERDSRGLHHLLAVGYNALGEMRVGRMIRHKERLAHGIMGDEGLRAGPDAPQQRALPLVPGQPGPKGHHMPIDISALAWWGWHQRWHQRLRGIDAFELPQKLAPGGTVRAPPQQRGQGRLVGVERRQRLAPQQGRKNERLEATPQRLRAVMPQRKGGSGMLGTIGVNRWLQQGNDRTHAPVLLPPRGEAVDTNKRQSRSDTDAGPLRLSCFFDRPRGAAAFSLD